MACFFMAPRVKTRTSPLEVSEVMYSVARRCSTRRNTPRAIRIPKFLQRCEL